MPFDFKKEQKDFYLPPTKPMLVDVPPMHYIAVRGSGDPNAAGGAYQHAIGQLYAIAYTIKMSHKGSRQIEGYFPYVVPPLEGFWWQDDAAGIDYSRKAAFQWLSAIRLPDFVTNEDFAWAIEEAATKKKQDFSDVVFFPYAEGLCVQCMHIGAYDDEPATIQRMTAFAEAEGYATDITAIRHHHEIYLSDPRKCELAQQRTVVRHPVRKHTAKD